MNIDESEGIDWRPLEAILPPKECDGFMYMAQLEVDGRPLHLYKHIDTRRYLNLTDQFKAYRYLGGESTYAPLSVKRAILHVLEDLCELHPAEYTPSSIARLADEGARRARRRRLDRQRLAH